MRIAISGTSGQGKSTLVENFLRRWKMYKTPEKTYRDIIKENDLNHSSSTTAETQITILDWMTKELDKNKDETHIIYDRCPWDNLAYTLHANERDLVSDEITAAVIDIVKASLKKVDIIFWLKYDPKIKIVDDGTRDTDTDYIKAVDTVFFELFKQYSDHLTETPFYIAEDCPAIIEIQGSSVDDRVSWIGEFLDDKGDLIETGKSILDPENLELMEQMLKEQGLWQEKDSEFKQITENIKNIKL